MSQNPTVIKLWSSNAEPRLALPKPVFYHVAYTMWHMTPCPLPSAGKWEEGPATSSISLSSLESTPGLRELPELLEAGVLSVP